MQIQLINPYTGAALTEFPDKLEDANGAVFPCVNGAFRIVSDVNYTDNFGFQWNRFAKTQLDRFQQSSNQSYERFFAVTGWDRENLSGKSILEVGSGAGRFSQIVLQHTGANLYSVDYSNAVEANFRNNGPHPRLKLFQASIYDLPFLPGQFDKVFCFGVLQHTPNFKESVRQLTRMVKDGGELVVDFYPIRGWYTKLHAKYLFRYFTRRMKHDQLLRTIENNADRLIKAYNFLTRTGLHVLTRFLPVCDIRNTIPPGLEKGSLREWVVLDTFDMFSPEYDNPQRKLTVEKWFNEFGMKNVKAYTLTYSGSNRVTVVKGIR